MLRLSIRQWFSYSALLLVCFVFIFVPNVSEAGNTVSINFGDVMRPIDWVVAGAPNCRADNNYPPLAGDGIAAAWSGLKPSTGTFDFGGRTVNASAGSYQFWCEIPATAIRDTATLVVCNNVTNQSDGGSSCIAKAPAKPASPNGTPGACNSGYIDLTWTSVLGATSYTVRDTILNQDVYTGPGFSHRHPGLVAGSAHRYVVSASNGALVSVPSDPFDAVAPAACVYPDLVAGAPTASSASGKRGVDTITITATIRNTGGASTVGGFNIGQFYIDSDGDNNSNYTTSVSRVVTPTAAGSQQIISATWAIPAGVPLGANYRFGYHADTNNEVNEGSGDSTTANWSGWSGSFRVVDEVPSVPTISSVSPGLCDSGMITISWSNPDRATYYTLRDGGTTIYTGPATSYLHTVAANSAHSYTLSAGNSSGDSLFSSPTSGTGPIVCTPPTPALTAATDGQCGGYIRLNWSNSAASYYEVSSDAGATWSDVGNVTVALLTLSPGVTYNGLRVRAWNGSGPSAPDSASAVASAACTAPILNNQTHSGVEQTSATVAATITSAGGGGQSISERGFCWGTSNNPSTNCTSAGGLTTGDYGQVISGLPAGLTVFYRAYAINSIDTGYSPSGSFLTKPATPGNPREAAPSLCDSRQINLTWDPVTSATSYEVLRDGVLVQTVAGTSYTVTGLNHGQAYNFSLRALNATGQSGYSVASSISAPAECRYPDLKALAPTLSTTQIRYGDTITFTSVIENRGGEPSPASGFTNGNLFIDANNDGNHEGSIPLVPMSAVTVAIPVGGSQTVTRSWTVPVGTPLGSQYSVGYFADRPSTVNEGPGPLWDNWSTWSGYFSVVEPEPATPTNFVANVAPVMPPACGGRINLAWNHMTYAASYEISVNGGAWINVGYVDRFSLDTSHGLSAGNNATIRIQARNTTGPSAPASLVVRASNMCTDLFGTTCDITLNQNSCNTATAMWDMTGGLPAFSIQNNTNGGFVFGNTMTGSAANIVMRYGVNNILAYSDSGTERAVWAPTIACAGGLFFHPTQNVCKAIPTIDLNVIPSTGIIRRGNTASIRTRVTAEYDLTCTFSNNLVTGGQIDHRGGIATDVTRATVPMTAGQIIQVNCRVPGNPNPVFTDDIRIEVVTEYSET